MLNEAVGYENKGRPGFSGAVFFSRITNIL